MSISLAHLVKDTNISVDDLCIGISRWQVKATCQIPLLLPLSSYSCISKYVGGNRLLILQNLTRTDLIVSIVDVCKNMHVYFLLDLHQIAMLVFADAGGLLGGAAAAYSAHGTFESVGCIIRQMDDKKRKLLYEQALTILNKFSVTDIVALNALVAGETAFRHDMIGVIIDHLHDNLSLDVIK